MNKDIFVQNIKKFCEKKGVKETVACLESGAGKQFMQHLKNGSEPSIGKVESLAHYLGTTVSVLIGETEPSHSDKVMTLHDSAAGNWKPDHISLSVQEVEFMRDYKNAPPEVQQAARDMVARYKKGTTSEVG